MSYESDMYIDQDALDVEWLHQPALMMKYTNLQANARREIDRQKEAVAVMKAQIGKDIRDDPDRYRIEKITDKVVEAAILLEERYQTINSELIDVQYEYQMLNGAVAAVEQRKAALEGMSKLLGLQYFAGPKVPRNLNDEVAKRNRQGRVDSTVKMKRRRRK